MIAVEEQEQDEVCHPCERTEKRGSGITADACAEHKVCNTEVVGGRPWPGGSEMR